MRLFVKNAELVTAADWTRLAERLLERNRIPDAVRVCELGAVPLPRVFFGETPAELEGHMHDIARSEKLALGVLCTVMIGIGIFPGVIVPMMQSGMNYVLALLGGA